MHKCGNQQQHLTTTHLPVLTLSLLSYREHSGSSGPSGLMGSYCEGQLPGSSRLRNHHQQCHHGGHSRQCSCRCAGKGATDHLLHGRQPKQVRYCCLAAPCVCARAMTLKIRILVNTLCIKYLRTLYARSARRMCHSTNSSLTYGRLCVCPHQMELVSQAHANHCEHHLCQPGSSWHLSL